MQLLVMGTGLFKSLLVVVHTPTRSRSYPPPLGAVCLYAAGRFSSKNQVLSLEVAEYAARCSSVRHRRLSTSFRCGPVNVWVVVGWGGVGLGGVG
jgi:hypothetical protein